MWALALLPLAGLAAPLEGLHANLGLAGLPDSRAALGLDDGEVLVADLSTDLDEQIPQLAAQGLLNRDTPLLWINQASVGWGHGEAAWIAYYGETQGFRWTKVASCEELLRRVAPALNGLVLYDATGITDEAVLAINLANLNGCLPVSMRVYARYRAAFGDVPVPFSVPRDTLTRPDAYRWLIDEALPLTDRSTVFSLRVLEGEYPHGTNQSLDYAFARRCLVYSLAAGDDMAPGDASLADEILAGLERPARVFGWGDNEFQFCKRLSLRGHTWCASVAAPNLSFHAAVVPLSPPPYVQANVPTVDVPERKCYLAFVANEGDTTTVLTQGYYRGWYQPARGHVPVSWAMNPVYAERFPAAVEYYMRSRTAMDHFVCAPSGPGYFYPQYMPNAYLRDVLTDGARLMREGVNLTAVELWQGDARRALSAYVDLWPNLRGLTLEHEVAPRLSVESSDGSRHVPLLGHGPEQQYWITREEFVNEGHVNVPGLLDHLESLYDPERLPRFLPFYGCNEDIPNGLLKLQDALDPERFEIVDLGTLMHLAAQVPPAEAPPARPVNRRWEPSLLRDIAAWSDVMNDAIVTVPDAGLRIEIPPGASWAIAAIPDLLLPGSCESLDVRVAELHSESGGWIVKCYSDFGGVGHFSTWLPVDFQSREAAVSVPIVEQVLDARSRPMRQFQVGLVGDPGDYVVYGSIDFTP